MLSLTVRGNMVSIKLNTERERTSNATSPMTELRGTGSDRHTGWKFISLFQHENQNWINPPLWVKSSLTGSWTVLSSRDRIVFQKVRCFHPSVLSGWIRLPRLRRVTSMLLLDRFRIRSALDWDQEVQNVSEASRSASHTLSGVTDQSFFT